MIRVLLIEDSPADAAHLAGLLAEAEREDIVPTCATTLDEALARLETHPFDAAMLELRAGGGPNLPGLHRLHEHAPLLPIVLLCKRGERVAAVRALEHGAADYVEEEERSAAILARTLRYAIDRARSSEQLAFLARHDPLTGLANRAAFGDRLAQALARSRRTSRPGALMLIDLDSFKVVNDTRGHDTGDLLLRHVAEQLHRFVRPYDTLARLGGDEFGILLEEVTEARDAGRLAKRLLAAIAAPFVVEQDEIFTTASLGAAIFPFDGEEPAELLRHADFAMYRAKRRGGGTAAFYTPSMGQRIREQLTLEHDLHRALARDELVLHYQPQVCLHTGEIAGLEALVRWQHPQRGLVPPHAFIPTAEKSGMIEAIGEWALRTACRQRQEWARTRLSAGRISVNVSPRQLNGSTFVDAAERVLREEELDPLLLELEITETLFLDANPSTLEKLSRLRRLGVRIAIDDFGTGYSCLAQLARLPVDALKIDRTLVGHAGSGRQGTVVTRAILVLARELGLAVVGEGVETEPQVSFLREHGCDTIQGMLVSSPLPPEEIPGWIRAVRAAAGEAPNASPRPAWAL